MNQIKKIFFLILISRFNLIGAKDNSEEPFQVYIKPHSRLSNLTYTSYVETAKGIYAFVIEKDHVARSEFWVLDKKGEKQYQVYSKDIVEIKDDVNILPNEIGSKTYPPASLEKIIDNKLQLESEISLHFDSLKMSPIQNINADSIDNVLAPRYQLTTNFIPLLPINAGITMSLQEAAWKDQNQLTTQINIFSIGPNFKYRILEDNNYTAAATFSYEFALNYKSSSSNFSNSFSAYIWSLGIVNEFKTILGPIQVGFDYRKHYLQLKDVNSTYPSDEYSISSVGAYIGYKINWEL